MDISVCFARWAPSRHSPPLIDFPAITRQPTERRVNQPIARPLAIRFTGSLPALCRPTQRIDFAVLTPADRGWFVTNENFALRAHSVSGCNGSTLALGQLAPQPHHPGKGQRRFVDERLGAGFGVDRLVRTRARPQPRVR